VLSLEEPAGKGKRKLGAVEEDDKEDFEEIPPIRGQHGKCEPISLCYAYLDEKVRDRAMAGTLAPKSLPMVIP
jgi:hypothetical protein